MHTRHDVSSALAIALIALAAACARPPSEGAVRWWSHVEVLASDELEGRNTGSEGYRRAAEYVADRFQEYGARPGNGDSYYQPVEFVSRTIREEESSMELVDAAGVRPITLGKEAFFSMSLEPEERVEAPLVFVGYGLKVPEIGHDDFAGIDLRGKVAVYLRGGPEALEGPLRAHVQSTEERWRHMHDAGAIGQVHLANPKHVDVPWERSTLRRLTASMTLKNPAMDRRPGCRVAITFNPDHAELLFEGTEHTFQELLDMANREETLPRFALGRSLRTKLAYDREDLESDNVVAIIPGTDPELKSEYVVLSGHLDGLGIGGVIEGDSIYNGAMDNASGIATMIEMARLARDGEVALKRSLMLLAVTGEEKGLLGSQYFAHNPSVDAGAIVANLNMDMYLPVIPLEKLVVYGIEESDLGGLMPGLVRKYGVELQPDPRPDRNIFIRSDQYNFIKTGVPALSFKFGALPDSPEDEVMKLWIKERYHAPSDDVFQPVNAEAASQFTRMLFDLCAEVANRPERPAWKANSFFSRFAKPEAVAQRDLEGAGSSGR